MSDNESTDTVDQLQRLRARLDAVDGELVGRLAERQALVEEVAALKRGAPRRPLRDTAREASLLGRVADLARGGGLDADFVVRLFQEIVDHSVRQQQLRLSEGVVDHAVSHRVVAHLGQPGSYSAQAARRHFEAHPGPVVFRTGGGFAELARAVHEGLADYSVLPIENTTAGSITEVYDLLAEGGLHIVGEEVQPIDHCLIGLTAEVALGHIKRVCSHPQALSQCRAFLKRLPQATVEAVADTATAVTRVEQDQDLSQAAIASAEAARIHGLPILLEDIADHLPNFTRFVIVASSPRAFDERVSCKTSLIFTAQHRHGALVSALQVFADHALNLTKLESRPQPGQPWAYRFYVDLEGNVSEPAVARALSALAATTASMNVLGSYPARTTDAGAPTPPEGS